MQRPGQEYRTVASRIAATESLKPVATCGKIFSLTISLERWSEKWWS